MSALLVFSASILVLSIAGLRHATSENYPADSSPIGSMILVASMGGIVIALILFGVVVGMTIGVRG